MQAQETPSGMVQCELITSMDTRWAGSGTSGLLSRSTDLLSRYSTPPSSGGRHTTQRDSQTRTSTWPVSVTRWPEISARLLRRRGKRRHVSYRAWLTKSSVLQVTVARQAKTSPRVPHSKKGASCIIFDLLYYKKPRENYLYKKVVYHITHTPLLDLAVDEGHYVPLHATGPH